MKLFKKFSGENKKTAVLRYDSGKCMLYALKTSRVLLWTTEQYGIKTRRDRSIRKRNGHCVMHR